MSLRKGDHLLIKRGDHVLTEEDGEAYHEFEVMEQPQIEYVEGESEKGQTFYRPLIKVVK